MRAVISLVGDTIGAAVRAVRQCLDWSHQKLFERFAYPDWCFICGDPLIDRGIYYYCDECRDRHRLR